MMKCRHHRSLASYQVGLLAPAQRAKLEAHLRDCASCRHELAALGRCTELLGRIEPHSAPPATWGHVQARLQPRRRSASPVRQWAPVFAAALVLLMVAMVLLPGLHSPVQPGLPNSDGYAQVQIAAAWDNPLADKAALGLALIAVDTDGGAAGTDSEVLD